MGFTCFPLLADIDAGVEIMGFRTLGIRWSGAIVMTNAFNGIGWLS